MELLYMGKQYCISHGLLSFFVAKKKQKKWRFKYVHDETHDVQYLKKTYEGKLYDFHSKVMVPIHFFNIYISGSHDIRIML